MRIFITIMILLVATIAYASGNSQQAQDEDPIQEKLTYGGVCISEKNYSKAKKVFEEVLDVDNNNVEALVGMGVASYYDLDYDDAKLYLIKAVSRNPSNDYIHFMLGRVFTSLGERSMALDELENISNQNMISDLKSALYDHELYEASVKSLFSNQGINATKCEGQVPNDRFSICVPVKGGAAKAYFSDWGLAYYTVLNNEMYFKIGTANEFKAKYVEIKSRQNHELSLKFDCVSRRAEIYESIIYDDKHNVIDKYDFKKIIFNNGDGIVKIGCDLILTQ